MDIVADIQRNIVVVDRIVHEPIPPRVPVSEIRLANKLPIGHIHQVVRNRDTDPHILDFVAPLILVWPPHARANAFARGVNPWMALRIFSEREYAEPPRCYRSSGIVEIDGISVAFLHCLWKINKHRSELAFVLERCRSEQNLIDTKSGGQVELNASVVLQHLETDRVFPADELLFRVDADIEVVVKQVVVRAIRSVSAAEDVSLCRRR